MLIYSINADGAYPRQPVADAIVSEALKDHPPAWWWGGKNAWVTWFLYMFIGRRFMVRNIFVSERLGSHDYIGLVAESYLWPEQTCRVQSA